ncbi:MAG: quinol:cytochrome C oxidoreductase [Pirellulaceae bacterium]|nr:quinol:cytochrome C oxidoreductase [Pirellulaceae bacterium]
MASHSIPNDNLTLPADWRSKAPALSAVGAVLVLLSVFLFVTISDGGLKGFFHSYLTNYMYCLTFCLAALFFVMVQHLVRAGWSAAVRRIAELYAATIPLWALLFIPILATVLMGSESLYSWNRGAGQGLPEIVENKLAFLNSKFFAVRTLVYFLVFIAAARLFFGSSRRQDETGDAGITLRLQKLAAPGIMLFSLSLNFAAFDWMMSTDPAWFSTIYGVYIFAAGMFSFFAVMILTCYLLQQRGRAERIIRIEHYHDLAKFQFGFIVFWSYIAFSQFMLYWYGNIPEETLWYSHRMSGGWEYVGLLLLAFHFIVPFLAFLRRRHRRWPAWLAGWACLLLVVHWLDMTFLIMPNVGAPSLSMMIAHLAGWAGMVLIFVGLFLWRVGDTPVVAVNDPWLPDSLAYQNLP